MTRTGLTRGDTLTALTAPCRRAPHFTTIDNSGNSGRGCGRDSPFTSEPIGATLMVRGIGALPAGPLVGATSFGRKGPEHVENTQQAWGRARSHTTVSRSSVRGRTHRDDGVWCRRRADSSNQFRHVGRRAEHCAGRRAGRGTQRHVGIGEQRQVDGSRAGPQSQRQARGEHEPVTAPARHDWCQDPRPRGTGGFQPGGPESGIAALPPLFDRGAMERPLRTDRGAGTGRGRLGAVAAPHGEPPLLQPAARRHRRASVGARGRVPRGHQPVLAARPVAVLERPRTGVAGRRQLTRVVSGRSRQRRAARDLGRQAERSRAEALHARSCGQGRTVGARQRQSGQAGRGDGRDRGQEPRASVDHRGQLRPHRHLLIADVRRTRSTPARLAATRRTRRM